MFRKIKQFLDAQFLQKSREAETETDKTDSTALQQASRLPAAGPPRWVQPTAEFRKFRFAYGEHQEPYARSFRDAHSIDYITYRPNKSSTLRSDIEEIEAAGQIFVVRSMYGHLFFRDPHRSTADHAFFLENTYHEDFAAHYVRQKFGRCIMHVARCMKANECVYFFFRRDATGFALLITAEKDSEHRRYSHLEQERVDFRRDSLPDGIDDVLTAPIEEMHLLCEQLFEATINPALQLSYHYREKLQDISLTWQSGSEEDFRSLVQAICLTDPEIFDEENTQPVTVVFRATTPYKRGGFRYVERDYETHTSPRLTALCDLAFRLNPFGGMDWVEHRTLRGNYQRAAKRVQVTVSPPSAHEKAEAYLTLIEWLDATLYDTEKRARYGLYPRAEPGA